MAQCERTLDDGERCSNQAVPGTRYCKTHGRILFHPITKVAADTAPAPREPPSPEAPPPEPSPPESPPPAAVPASELRARPSALNEAISFPGLVLDQRQLLVAPEGIVWLAADPQGPPGEPFDRLVRCLSFLSQALALPGHVRILRQGEDGDSLLLLTPEPGHTALSSSYDVVSAAARLVEGRLYVGQESAFVQYRDDRAPRGYDVPDFDGARKSTADEDELLLVARWGSRRLRHDDFDEVQLAELVCQVAPPPSPSPAVPHEEVYALMPPALYPLLARYFRAHHLRYSVARLEVPPSQRTAQEGGELILLEVRSRLGAPGGSLIPPFVLDYLSRFPRLSLLASGHRTPRRHVLVQHGRRHPFDLPHIEAAFDDDELVLLQTDPYPNLRARPAPHFFDGDRLTTVHTPQVASPERLAPRAAGELSDLRLPILLRPDPGPVPPIAAIILNLRELAWLRRLLYRQPAEALADLRILVAEERALLVGDREPIEGLPFGLPLRRRADSGLFLPLRSRFVPELPWTLLTAALGLRDDVYTFFMDKERLDVPVADFAPLSRALVADPSRPPAALTMQSRVALADFRWAAPAAPPVEIRRPRTAAEAVEPAATTRPAAPAEAGASSLESPDGTAEYLRRQAVSFEDKKDYLAAAVCYGLIHDALNSARCYRRAAREMAVAS